MSRRMKIIGLAIAIISIASIAYAGTQADSVGQLQVVTQFDPLQTQLPEGLIIDKTGNIYVSLGLPGFIGSDYGGVWKISPDGTGTTVLAEFPGGPAPAGLAIDAPGNLYFALPADEDGIRGVYRFSKEGGVERLPGTEAILIPNGLIFDKQGNLYVGDSGKGIVWRIVRDGSARPEIWFQHPWISGCPEDPFGANGVAYWQGNIYVASTANGLLVRVPVLQDGTASDQPDLIAGDEDCEATDELYGMDGIALDVHGTVYANIVLQNKLVRIDPSDGTVTTLKTGEDGLWNPASLAFGTGKGDRENLYISNYAVIPPAPENSLGPAVLKIDVGVPGLPLP